MHLLDTLSKKVSHLKHEQEGIKDNCSRSSNASCGSLPLNKELITNNLWLTAAISLCLTLTNPNPINFYWCASGPSLYLFWTSIACQCNALSLLEPYHNTVFYCCMLSSQPPYESTIPVEDIAWYLLQILKCICHLLNSLLSPQVWLDQGDWVPLPFQKVFLGYCSHCA